LGYSIVPITPGSTPYEPYTTGTDDVLVIVAIAMEYNSDITKTMSSKNADNITSEITDTLSHDIYTLSLKVCRKCQPLVIVRSIRV